MNVIQPTHHKARPKRRRPLPYIATGVGLLVALAAANYLRPLPAATVNVHIHLPTSTPVSLAWPAAGQSAVAADGYGILGTAGNQTPLATASIAKVITALCVLQKEPLIAGEGGGPTYTTDSTDVALYESYATEGGSLVAVQPGEKLTEYQALEALMLPSANNVADSLVRWVFGSQAAYASYATTFLHQHGIEDTHIGTDASGFDPSTTSTASDLTEIGLLALQNPVLMQIVGQKSTVLPVAGTVANYDTILGQSGINGIKTGNSTTDMGAFLFSATKQMDGKNVDMTGTVMGAPNLKTALQESVQLATSLGHGFRQITITQTHQTIGVMQTAWGTSTPIITDSATQLVQWEDSPVTERHQINTHLLNGSVGTLEVNAGPSIASTSLRLAHPLAGPRFLWRLTRH